MSSSTNTKTKRVLSLLVGRDDGIVRSYFGIIHENNLWLVTSWLINSSTGYATPERMILIDQGRYQRCDPDDEFDYANILIPKDVIEGVTEDVEGYVVKSLPDAPVVHRDELYQLPNIF